MFSARHLDESVITLQPDWPVVRQLFRACGAVYSIQTCDSRVKMVGVDKPSILATLKSNSGTLGQQMAHGAVTPPRVVTIPSKQQTAQGKKQSRLHPVDNGPTETEIRAFNSKNAVESRLLKATGKSASAKTGNQPRFNRASVAVVPVYSCDEVCCVRSVWICIVLSV